MNKHELVGLTIDRLMDHFKLSPESFEYHDSDRSSHRASQPTIIWQPKIQLNDYMNTVVPDANNNHGVIVTWNTNVNELSCFLFMKVPIDLNGSKADGCMSCKRWFEKYRGNYKKFKRLRDLIVDRERHKENMYYLKKLSSVFPDTLDNNFLKD